MDINRTFHRERDEFMIAFYNTKNHHWVSGFDFETQKVKYYDGKEQDHVAVFNTKSSEIKRICWNLADYIVAVKIPISKFRECLKQDKPKSKKK